MNFLFVQVPFVIINELLPVFWQKFCGFYVLRAFPNTLVFFYFFKCQLLKAQEAVKKKNLFNGFRFPHLQILVLGGKWHQLWRLILALLIYFVTLLITVNLRGVADLWQCLSSATRASSNTQEINKYQTHHPSARHHWWALKAVWPEAVDQPPSDSSEGQRPKSAIRMSSLKDVCSGLLLDPLPPNRGRDPSVPHAPVRAPNLTAEEERVSENSYRLSYKAHFFRLGFLKVVIWFDDRIWSYEEWTL